MEHFHSEFHGEFCAFSISETSVYILFFWNSLRELCWTLSKKGEKNWMNSYELCDVLWNSLIPSLSFQIALQFPYRFWDSKIQGADFFGHVPPNSSQRGLFSVFYDMDPEVTYSIRIFCWPFRNVVWNLNAKITEKWKLPFFFFWWCFFFPFKWSGITFIYQEKADLYFFVVNGNIFPGMGTK